MKSVFITMIAAQIIGMLSCMFFFAKKSDRFSKPQIGLFLLSIFSTLMYTISLFIKDHNIQIFFSSIHIIGLDWLLLTWLNYSALFTKMDLKNKRITITKHILILLALIDMVVIIINIYNKWAFDMTAIHDSKGNIEYWKHYYRKWFLPHLLLCSLTAISVVLNFCIKIKNSPSIYRLKYVLFMLSFIIVMIIESLYLILDFRYNYAILLYTILSLIVGYFLFAVAPQDLISSVLASISENINSAVLCFDVKSNCIYKNKLARSMFVNNDLLCNHILELEHMNKNLVQRQTELNIYKDNSIRTLAEEYRRLEDNKNRFIGSYLKIDDITEEIKLLKQEKYKATHDPLTGLYNRSGFFERVRQILDESPDVPRYIVCSNIKNFKLVNDLFGTKTGDKILIKQGKLFEEIKIENCVAGRISADRFALLINKEYYRREIALENINKIQELTQDMNYKLCIVNGVYEIVNPKENVKTMYDKANLALKSLKDDYEEKIAFYDTLLMEKLVQENNIISEFNIALGEGQFNMYLQPQISNTGKLLGAEALVRWQHPQKGLVSPGIFIPIFERTGFIYRLDEYMWECAARKLRQWKNEGREDLYISVNISAKDFYYLDLYTIFTNIVELYRINPRNLNLEITETALMHDIKTHIKVLSRLQEYGFRIEMDDFGSGYSSLNMLKDIVVDVLKIDMGFLRKTQNEERSKIILNTIMEMAKSLNMTVVTEGVETQSQLDYLKEIGCDIFQGYYYSKPIPVEEFEEKYLKN